MLKNEHELSRIIVLEDLCSTQAPYILESTQEECTLLSKRFGLRSIETLTVQISVLEGKMNNERYIIQGKLNSSIVQKSVVSLKDISQTISSSFFIRIFDKSNEKEIVEEQKNDHDIEFSQDGKIDIGEISAQYLSISIDPYPRENGEDLNTKDHKKSLENPFSVLKSIKDNV